MLFKILFTEKDTVTEGTLKQRMVRIEMRQKISPNWKDLIAIVTFVGMIWA